MRAMLAAFLMMGIIAMISPMFGELEGDYQKNRALSEAENFLCYRKAAALTVLDSIPSSDQLITVDTSYLPSGYLNRGGWQAYYLVSTTTSSDAIGFLYIWGTTTADDVAARATKLSGDYLYGTLNKIGYRRSTASEISTPTRSTISVSQMPSTSRIAIDSLVSLYTIY
jgi:hypothetical protein